MSGLYVRAKSLTRREWEIKNEFDFGFLEPVYDPLDVVNSDYDPDMRLEWKRHVKNCKMLGKKSNLWKIPAFSSSEKIKMAARKVFDRCEYGRFKRIFDWKNSPVIDNT